MKKTLLLCIALVAALGTMAQTPQQLASVRLKKVLGDMIKNHTAIPYNSLADMYPYTDLRPNGTIWDIYSDKGNLTLSKTGSSNGEGQTYNKEHTVPQSWFNEASPMKSDLFHVLPTDSYINNMRSNMPYGEVGSPTKQSANGFSKVGLCVTPGYSGTVFEPNDEYKGDVARIYFYMVTCYYDKVGGWSGGVFGQKDKFADYKGYPGMAEWQLKMLIRWAKQDPVSQKEIDRNNAVYQKQGNRNPFVDCPGLERFIWSEYAE